jgi:hypothetical protein
VRLLAAVVVGLWALAAPAAAQDDDRCLTADPPPVTKPAHQLRFGITPAAAGSVGATQAQVAPIDEGTADAALRDLRPRGKTLVMRLNRLFWADGDEGIERFARTIDRYEAQGFRTESQVRYHPPEGSAGDIPAWEAYVRKAVRELGRRRSVVAFSITNEANLSISPNTSDGAYPGVVDALVRGVIVANEELARMGRSDIDVGFTLMWRFTPESDARFWNDIAARATPEFHAALDYVGLQIYPGLVWPPAPRPGVSAGEEVIEALTLLRRCYMPKASLREDVDLWVSENGYATNLGRSEPDQAVALDSTVRALHRWSGELGISDYRWFNLRDNNSDGTDLFAAVGLLRDDYSPKPAFAGFRGLVGLFGTDEGAGGGSGGGSDSGRAAPRVSFRVSPAADRRGPRTFTTRGRVLVPSGAQTRSCSGSVSIRYRAGRRTISNRRARVTRGCTFVSRVRFMLPQRFAGHRTLRVSARFNGNSQLRPADAARSRSVRVR